MREMKFRLDGKNPVPCSDVIEWGKWFEKSNRHVADTKIGDVRVSTVFLGLDHGFGSAPILFETMVFGGNFDEEMNRYHTWEEAEKGHAEMVRKVEAGK